MSEIYRDKILDHYNSPRNYGKLKNFTHFATVENLSCGDKIKLWLKIDENETIKMLGFEGEGCVISIAAMSLFGQEILGKKVMDVVLYKENDIVDMLGIKLGPARLKCALLSLRVLHKALHNNDIGDPRND